MAQRTVNMTLTVKVRIDPAGRKPTLWGRLKLALSILFGRPVGFDYRTSRV